MNVVTWILQGLLALMFLASGVVKLVQSRKELAPRMPYVEDFSDGAIKAIGAVEVLGAIGVILPAATGIAPILTPIAATGLALIMVGAIIVHQRRNELRQSLPINLALFALAALVAILRFGPYSL
jgi:uncharacterized membrane protein YphA (DoxX/SURF4 family)